eukprot:TRINITY_DN2657_c0_g1_i1.p1 TRINITY_DN2657_c0_g1~~TRINITY_DN2657_c0_g1_i1.p1  ORF type:complete len:1023 (+),score=326.65 TRINITY_DN2657_c0_g1_i1:29-3097(+)
MSSTDNSGKKSSKRLQITYPVVEYTEEITPGEKKSIDVEAPSTFSPKFVEAGWYQWWESQGFFKPRPADEKFVMMLPPPNVTGSLHLGHALTVSVQDIFARYYRMRGFETLYLPGCDHAGIATQNVVEKRLANDPVNPTTRRELGREEFTKKVFEWKDEYEAKICNQLRRMGGSLDWSRQVFTMDEERSNAVVEAFYQFSEAGLMKRDVRLVNWDCTLRTAISNVEVEKVEVKKKTFFNVPNHPKTEKYIFGVLEYFYYPIKDSDEKLLIATTRLETMMADTAVAVNPKDPRYTHLHKDEKGNNIQSYVIHPFHKTEIPIITDADAVDIEFGTGAVKITPGHDENDFRTGVKHKLEFINMFNDDGTLNNVGAEYEGMPRYVARNRIREKLQEMDLYDRMEDNEMVIGFCDRSKDIMEPIMKPQWFVDMKTLAKRSVEAVEQGEIEISPANFTNRWYQWLTDIQDWCVSRQLWWGHQIPAWYVYFVDEDGNCVSEDVLGDVDREDKEKWIVAHNEEEALELAKLKYPNKLIKLERDEDVLDTWWSSGLFPFATLGWPNKTEDMDLYFPNTILETGTDILFFWVARMVMMSLQLTGKVPFKKIWLHTLVRDAHGRKMSKSLGNVIDPLDVINGISLEALQQSLVGGNLDEREIKKAQNGQAKDFPVGIPECGTDGLRMGLVFYTGRETDVNLDVNKVVCYRNFCNKLWNASINFAFPYFTPELFEEPMIPIEEMPSVHQWIFSRLRHCLQIVDESINNFQLSLATESIVKFFENEFCNTYLEISKIFLRSEDKLLAKLTARVLYEIIEISLRMMHPIVPFVSEEIWQRMRRVAGTVDDIPSIMLASYPRVEDYQMDEELEKRLLDDMNLTLDIIGGFRSIRGQYSVAPQKKLRSWLTGKTSIVELDQYMIDLIATQCSLSDIHFVLSSDQSIPKICGMQTITGEITVCIDLSDSMDVGKEIVKIEKDMMKITVKRDKILAKMAKPQYDAKVPEIVKAKNVQELEDFESQIATMIQKLEELKIFV